MADDRARYSMRVVAKLTGLPPDTIRAWERRYGAVTPERSDGGTRRFSAADVRRLSLLREATDRGHAIGNVADLSDEAIEALVSAPEAAPHGPGGADLEADALAALRERYLAAVTRFEARRAQALIERAAALMAPRDFALEVALPLLREVGERFSHSELGVAQEHLVSSQLSGLMGTLGRLVPADPRPRRVLLTTPAGHTHGFGVLVAALLVASRGFEPVYLGTDLPDRELIWAAGVSGAELVILGVTRSIPEEEAERLVGVFGELAGLCDVWVGTPEGHALAERPSAARLFHRFEDLDLALAGRRAAP